MLSEEKCASFTRVCGATGVSSWMRGRRNRTHLANADECLRNDSVERFRDVVLLLEDHADEVGLVRESLEEEERFHRVAVLVEVGG